MIESRKLDKNVSIYANEEAKEESDIHIAYLILAHTNPDMLGRLINALDDDRVHFFIHVHMKADLKKYLPHTIQTKCALFQK